MDANEAREAARNGIEERTSITIEVLLNEIRAKAVCGFYYHEVNLTHLPTEVVINTRNHFIELGYKITNIFDCDQFNISWG